MSMREEDGELARLYAASISETTPVLLELARQQAARRRPRELVAQLERDGFVAPLALDQRLVHRLDGLALAAASGYEAVQLAPVAPLGACSVVGLTSQDRTLTATRGTEVVSDPTNALALISAQRLLGAPHQPVRLCTTHQVLRAQPFERRPGHSRHFRMFALTDAGRAEASDGFEVSALTRQLGVLDRLFDLLERDLGLQFPARRAIIRTTAQRDVLGQRLAERLHESLPHVAQTREPLGQAYYDGVRLGFGATSVDGEFIPIGDGGAFDWLTQLCSNRRLRFVASGFGLQLAPLLFRRAP
jgi:hypothetical protein